jgi:DNA-binding SARP family transcriptional activator
VAFERQEDVWGAALATLMEGWAALAVPRGPVDGLLKAAEAFGRLGAEVLETWARAAHALSLARANDPAAYSAAVRAELAARSLGIPGAQAVAYTALAQIDPARSRGHRSLARALQEECSLAIPGADPPAWTAEDLRAESPSLVVRCFGRFEILVDGRAIDLSAVKPRARRLLRLLAMHAGSPVHREVLTEALWTDADPRAAMRYLHVAVSSLRHVLEPDAPRGASSLIVRDGDAYRLRLPPDGSVDVVEFDRALAQGRAARGEGDVDTAVARYRSAIRLHRAELLPEDGPAEWLVHERERRAAEACEAARALAEILLELDDQAGAAIACEQGLAIDRYRDDLWRLRAFAHERAGDLAAAAQVRRGYNAVLGELGLAETSIR